MPRHPHSSQALTTVSEEDWALAREREPIVRDLVQNPPAYGARAEAMAAAASELALTPNHLYRLLKAYEAAPRTRSLLLKAPGPASGGKRLDDRVEAIIEEEIKGTYLTLHHPKKSLLMKGIHARCAAEGLTRPARQTVDTRLAAISKREQTKRRHGRKRARDEFNPIRGSLEAERALEIIQIDHTPTDLMAVEPDSLEVIGRPFITLAVDIRTRMYCGFYLTFDPPSATSVAACIAHAVMDKSEWLASRGLPARWPVMGLCEVVHTDNGKEFHSKAFTRACEDYGIELRYRPPGTPHMGGHVERRIGHLSQELHLLPGTTFSNIKERGVYDAAGNACLTITEIEWLVASIILEHHASFHEGIGTSPNAKWAADTEGRVFRMPADLRTFHRDFLPFEERTVQRDGVHLFNISYWHEALTPFLHDKRKVTVHYNPADLSKVFIRGVSGEYLEVPYRNLRRPAISMWEHKAANRALRRQGRAGVDEAMIFDMVLARRKLVEEASGRSRRTRLERARGAGPRSTPALPAAPTAPVIDAAYRVLPDGADDAPLELPYYDTETWDD
ncbi:Mu transposase C-terminal domain-containing protein [Azospirillum agricola]|uniref:Mu transposase C-terminal domain-containing protein n=1 Tax=Azospirillum agricola TaxID=1720247 RepID=UPI000A0F0797|nr:Mu transposase C-terminal domain-containing protein [Azospirillum agricola]SMH28445.1 putative transposase [Azospirillum lipoferum]